MASMPSRPPSASSWPGITPNLPATWCGCAPRGPRSRPALSPGPSAPSRAPTRGSRPSWRRSWGWRSEPVSTQVIPRDRHAAFFATLAVVAGGIERLATEVRHLQRSEVREAEEFFHAGQKGSSAMPHKRNPVLSENLTGLARLVRGYAMPALENVALWHERDISHSSVERVIGPDATITLDFALVRLTGMMEKLTVYPERMQENLDSLGGVAHSQKVLLALTQAGMSRESAYSAVQAAAMATWTALGPARRPQLSRQSAGQPCGGGADGPGRRWMRRWIPAATSCMCSPSSPGSSAPTELQVGVMGQCLCDAARAPIMWPAA